MAASHWPARRPLTTDTAGPGPRIVALGGGTGLPVLLGGLREALFPRDRLASAGGAELRTAFASDSPSDATSTGG